MSLSNLCFKQHEQDQARLRKLLLWGLLGSVGVHAIALGLSQLNFGQAAADEMTPIELIVTDPLTEPLPDESEVLPDPSQPAELSPETNDPALALAPTAQALSPKAAVVTAPRPVVVAKPEIPESAEPEPLAETAGESELEVPEAEEEETPEAVLSPETIEPEETVVEAEPEAEPTEPDLATASEDSSQFERLRDFLQRQQNTEGEAVTEALVDGTPDLEGPPASNSTVTAETTAAKPGTGTSGAPNSSGGSGQSQGSRTVACQNCVRPDYPQSALDAGAEGQPMVSVDINPDGSVRSVTLTRSSGNPAIDQAAIQAARNSQFQPVSGGASVPIEYDLTIEGSRRNRNARRRGERQAVELPPEPSPPLETTTEPSPAPTATPPPVIDVTAPVDAVAPAAAPNSLAPSASPVPVRPTPEPSLPEPSTLPPSTPAAHADPPPEPVAPSPPTPPSLPSAVESSQPDAPTAE